MIEASFDMPKLERSLKRAAKAFGDTNKQAITRWSVQVGRELSVSTQAYGKSGTRQLQQFAIEADARKVVWPVKITGAAKGSTRFEHNGKRHNWPNSRVLREPAAVNDWIEMHRTRRRARTSELPFSELAICDERVFRAAMKIRFKNVGMAKGGWLGAANQAARFQTGAQRINIGKNFLGYAQKHGGKGSAKINSGGGFRPNAILSNRSPHVASPHVLAPSEINKAVGWGLKKTIQWYKKAAKTALDKA